MAAERANMLYGHGLCIGHCVQLSVKQSELTSATICNCSPTQKAQCALRCLEQVLNWSYFFFGQKYIRFCRIAFAAYTAANANFLIFPPHLFCFCNCPIEEKFSWSNFDETYYSISFHFSFAQSIACVGFNECWHWHAHCFQPHIGTRGGWFSLWQLCLNTKYQFTTSFSPDPHKSTPLWPIAVYKRDFCPTRTILISGCKPWFCTHLGLHGSVGRWILAALCILIYFLIGYIFWFKMQAPFPLLQLTIDKARHVATHLFGPSCSPHWCWVIAFLQSCFSCLWKIHIQTCRIASTVKTSCPSGCSCAESHL